jgi:hypothetical protein
MLAKQLHLMKYMYRFTCWLGCRLYHCVSFPFLFLQLLLGLCGGSLFCVCALLFQITVVAEDVSEGPVSKSCINNTACFCTRLCVLCAVWCVYNCVEIQ